MANLIDPQSWELYFIDMVHGLGTAMYRAHCPYERTAGIVVQGPAREIGRAEEQVHSLLVGSKPKTLCSSPLVVRDCWAS